MNLPSLLPPLLWTAVTVACYLIGLGLRQVSRKHALANPALITILLVVVLLRLTHTPYASYFRATWALTFLLAPATVALGIPLARNFAHIRQNLYGVGLGLLAGSVSSMLSGVLLVRWLGGSKELALCMLPKAVTTPIAIAVAGQIGGRDRRQRHRRRPGRNARGHPGGLCGHRHRAQRTGYRFARAGPGRDAPLSSRAGVRWST